MIIIITKLFIFFVLYQIAVSCGRSYCVQEKFSIARYHCQFEIINLFLIDFFPIKNFFGEYLNIVIIAILFFVTVNFQGRSFGSWYLTLFE